MIAMFIYHLQIPNGKSRSVGFLKTINSHVSVHGTASMFTSVQSKKVVGAPGSTHNAVGAPGSTHSARLLKESPIFIRF